MDPHAEIPASRRVRRLGELNVGPVAFGAAGLSMLDHPDEGEAVRLILSAVTNGVTLIDTAAAYVPSPRAPGHNEALVRRALACLAPGTDHVAVATKGGHTRIDDRGLASDFDICGRPEAIRQDCEASLRALGVDTIDLYQLHWPDPEVPIGESMLAFADLLASGQIRAAGLCNVSIEQIEEARRVIPIVSVQNRLSVSTPAGTEVIHHCQQNNIAFLAYGTLGGLGGAQDLATRAAAIALVAEARGISAHRVAIAWLLHQYEGLIPIVGARREPTLLDSLAALDAVLDTGELELLGSALQ